MKPISLILVVFLLLQTVVTVSSQTDPVNELAQHKHNTLMQSLMVLPQSPQAASFEKYGEFPVDLYTGRIDISVPLYNISGNTIGQPIVLKYNSGGVRVTSVSSWVGAGWDLNVAGVITRSVQGKPDLKATYYDRRADIDKLKLDNVNDYYHDRHKLQMEATGQHGGVYHELETQPDHYTLTFPGGGAKFYLLPNAMNDIEHSIRFKKAVDYKVVPAFAPDGKINSFLVIDAKGNRYHYDQFEETVSIPDASQGDIYSIDQHRTAWYLTLVESADGFDRIEYVYATNNQSYNIPMNPYSGDGVKIPLPNESSTSPPPPSCNSAPQSLCPIGISNVYGGINSISIINKKRLTTINYYHNNVLDTKVKLINGTASESGITIDKLSRLEIHRGRLGATLVKRFDFQYSTGSRLKLNRITEKSPSGTAIKQPYIFNYHNLQLPGKTSNAIDFWGFYNGAVTNTSLVPNFTDCNGNSYYGAYRQATSSSLAGSLTSVVYPTGGRTEFVFEPHVVAPIHGCWNPTTNTTVGGLRIKEVKSFSDATTLEFSKTYEYTLENSTESSGKLLTGLKYHDYSWFRQEPDDFLDPCDSGNRSSNCKSMIVYADPRSTQSSSEGEHVGYSRVKEIFSGSTVYSFKNESGGNRYYNPTNGEVTSIKKFDESGIIVQEQSFQYADDINENRRTGSWSVPVVEADQNQDNTSILCVYNNGYTSVGTWLMPNDPTTQCDDGVYSLGFSNNTKYSTSFYSIKTYWGYVKSATTTDYLKHSGNNRTAVTHTKIYNYNDPGIIKPTTINLTNSDGSNAQINFVYPTSTASENVISSSVRSEMLNKRMRHFAVQITYFRNGLQVDGTRMKYEMQNGHPYIKKSYRYETSWDQNGNFISSGAGYGWQKTIDNVSYLRGRISLLQKRGWFPSVYGYSNGYLTSINNLGFLQSFEYNDNNQMIKQTEIDGQSIYYNYDNDEPLRLHRVMARPKIASPTPTNSGHFNVVTTHERVYASGNGQRNYVESHESFTSGAYSGLSNLVNRNYFDGLGREIANVQVGYSPDRKDVIRSVDYNDQNLLFKAFEPFESAYNNGTFVSTPANTPFSESDFEQNPLKRLSSSTPPDWYATSKDYRTNPTSVIVDGVTYSAHSLFITSTSNPTNANWKMLTYTDKFGRTIMERKTDGSQNLDTKYGYDKKDRLVFVLPPGVNSASSDLAYRYVYDGRDRIIRKHIPDQEGWTKYYYNNKDLLTFSQDPRQALSNEWFHLKYDSYGRELSKGITYIAPITGDEIRPYQNLLSEKEYDGDGTNSIEKGKLTFERVRVLGAVPERFITRTYSYDDWGRNTQITGTNFKGGSETIVFTYDWADNLTRKTRTHVNGSTNLVIDEIYTYDHSGRLFRNYQRITKNGQLGSWVQISENDYTIKDQLSTLSLGKENSHPNPLQKVDYSYNTQGWLTYINQGAMSGSSTLTICSSGGGGVSTGPKTSSSNGGDVEKSVSADASDLFQLDLRYDNPMYPLGISHQRKDGSISQMTWKVKGRKAEGYAFNYDYTGRLMSASHRQITSSGFPLSIGNFSSSYTYDQRGNIATLARNGLIQNASCWDRKQIDNLAYSYYPNTNRLKSITDTGNGNGGFEQNGVSNTDYAYDANGNMTADPYKGMYIGYNFLNLPNRIQLSDGGVINIVYDGDGNKLSQTHTVSGNSEIRDYIGEIEYLNNSLDAINHAQGRVSYTSAHPNGMYQYRLTDHLGNTRIVFADLNQDGTINHTTEILQEHHYYPFGLEWNGPWGANGSGIDRYQYNGKELIEEVRLNDYGARWYDPAIARWSVIDPMAEDYRPHSPYNYVLNNPLIFVDPDGRTVDVTDLVKGNTEGDLYLLINLMAELSEMSGGAKISVNTSDKKSTLEFDPSEGDVGEKASNLYIEHLINGQGEITVKNQLRNPKPLTRRGFGKGSHVLGATNNVWLDPNQIKSFEESINASGQDGKTMGVGLVFLHETLHTPVGASFYKSGKKVNGRFIDPQGDFAKDSTPGEVVSRVNQFRRDAGLPERNTYSNYRSPTVSIGGKKVPITLKLYFY